MSYTSISTQTDFNNQVDSTHQVDFNNQTILQKESITQDKSQSLSLDYIRPSLENDQNYQDGLKKIKGQFHKALETDDLEIIEKLYRYKLISNQKILNYALLQNLEKIFSFYLDHELKLLELGPQEVSESLDQTESKLEVEESCLTNSFKWKLFYLACRYDRLKMLKEMYQKFSYQKEDLDVTNNSSKNMIEFSFLNLAIFEKNQRIVEFLLRMGANPEIKYPVNRNAPLHLAVRMAHQGIVKILLEYLENVDIPNLSNRNTPLHLAAQYGDLPITKMLVEAGANINLKNRQGYTPCDLAELEENSNLVEYFKSLEAESTFSRSLMI